MANRIKIKSSSTTSTVPVAGDLQEGELAINTTDKRLWSKTASTVFELTDHDILTNYVANEHLDWTASVGTIHTDNYIENVPTALSTGTVTATTYGITSDSGTDDVVLVEATTSVSGLLGADKWDEIVASTTHAALTNEHLDWSADQGATNIHVNNVTGYEPTDGTIVRTGDAAWNATDWDTAFGWGDHSGTLYEPYDTAIVKSDEAETITANWEFEAGFIHSSATLFQLRGTVSDPGAATGRTAILFRRYQSSSANYMRTYGNDVHFALYDAGEPTDKAKGIYGYFDNGGGSYINIDGDLVWTAADFTSTDVTNWDTAFGWGDHAGLYGTAAAVALNTAKLTNVSTTLSTGTVTATTYGITSDGGANDVILAEATTSLSGLLGADKWDEIVANSLKTTNATHTSHVTGATALTVVVAAITGQTDIGANLVATDEVIVSDGGVIRRADISRFNTYFDGALDFAASSHTHTFDSLTSKTSGTGNYNTTGDISADNFEAHGLGPNSTPGTDDMYLGGYGILGSRTGTIYVSNVTGAVSLNHTGVHATNTKLATTATGIDVTGNIGVTGTVDGIDIATDVAANTAKTSNVSTTLSTGTRTATTYGITSDGGANDVILAEATTSLSGLLGADKWDEIVANSLKTTNATHTGDVTGSGLLTIAAGAVDIAMLANGTDGELITWSAAAAPTTVAAGSADQVLTSNGAGAAPTFQAAAAGGFTPKAAMFGGSASPAMSATSSFITVDINIEYYDDETNYALASDIITVTDAGTYLVSYTFTFHPTGGATNDSIICQMTKNGTSSVLTQSRTQSLIYKSNTRPSQVVNTFLASLAASDTVRLRQACETGTSGTQSGSYTHITMMKVA